MPSRRSRQSHQSQEYLLPPLSDLLQPEREAQRPSSSWNPFDRSPSPDRGYIDYERAPSAETHGQDSARTVGLGISSASDPPRYAQSETELDNGQGAANVSANAGRIPSPEPSPATTLFDRSPDIRCPTKHNIVQRRLSWVPLTILVLAVYSTVFSGIYLVIAFVKPRYGKIVGEDGHLAPSTASLLSALFAKTIELSYVTVCVAFLGQVLSRRALAKGSRGITISDMSMRTWIMQPGALIVHWETLRYSALTFLGLLTLTATLVAMLYTTAAEALVSPKLAPGPLESRVLVGDVFASFANPVYMGMQCPTPIANKTDPDNRNTTCLELEHVGKAYHNYQAYLSIWSGIAVSETPASTDLDKRQPPIGSLYDNTTVTGSWIDQTNKTELSRRYGRMVNNITAAMPHGGIIGAAMKTENGIVQPRSLSGEGSYNLQASVPSPAVNILCVGMTAKELAPLVYTEWPDIGDKFDPVTWPVDPPDDIPVFPDWLNRTVVDDIFGFGPKYGQRPPVFGKLPEPYNTILNVTTLWPSDAIYLLGATDQDHPKYVMCSLKAKHSPLCSTHYNSTANGAELTAVCEKENNRLQYNRQVPDVIDGIWAPDWKNVASKWANALSLGTGITDGASSNARLLMQLVPSSFSLDPRLPSVGEALAVMAGSTLIMSSSFSPFVPFWNYTDPALETPEIQTFNSTLRTVGYASGGTESWQGLFYVILIFAFITSAICLAFMLFEVRGRQITDFTEPQNLFTLAMNSPSTSRLEGACGAGPEGPQLKERWYVGMEEDDAHYYIRTKHEENTPRLPQHRLSPVPVDIEEPSKSVSPAKDEYKRLSNQSSLLSRLY